MDPQVDRVLADARARSIEVGDRIGSTGYCHTYAVGDALVMRIPRSKFEPEGPFFVGTAPDSTSLARTLLESSTERQRGVDRGPVARFVDRLELDGVPVALHERAVGRAPRHDDLRAILRALSELHDVFGYHGHLVPAHVWVDGDRVTFTDPLPVYPDLLGGVGYALPLFAAELASRDEGLLLRDVAAVAAMMADSLDVGLGWTRQFATMLDEINRGRSRPWDPQPALAALLRRTGEVKTSDHTTLLHRGWIDMACRLGVDHYMPSPSVRPTTTKPRAAVPGTARSLLQSFLFHGTLGRLVRQLQTSPSLFDFIALERAAAIESYETRPDPVTAFNAREVSFGAILQALPALQANYLDAAPVAVAPIVHHPDVFPETHALRTLLLDLNRLLAPTPATVAEAGGLLARVERCVEDLRDPTRLMVAARRYINYVSNPNRVY